MTQSRCCSITSFDRTCENIGHSQTTVWTTFLGKYYLLDWILDSGLDWTLDSGLDSGLDSKVL